MNIVQTQEGALEILTLALGGSPSMVVRLYDNNVSVSDTTVLSDLNEASFISYAPVSPAWGTPATVGGLAQTVPSPTNVDFSYGGGSTATVYGAYITDSGNTKLLGATTFAVPFVFSTVVNLLKLFPVYTQNGKFTSS